MAEKKMQCTQFDPKANCIKDVGYMQIKNSTNEANIIKSCSVLAGLLPAISQNQLYDALVSTNVSIEEAQELLQLINLDEEEAVNDDQEAK